MTCQKKRIFCLALIFLIFTSFSTASNFQDYNHEINKDKILEEISMLSRDNHKQKLIEIFPYYDKLLSFESFADEDKYSKLIEEKYEEKLRIIIDDIYKDDVEGYQKINEMKSLISENYLLKDEFKEEIKELAINDIGKKDLYFLMKIGIVAFVLVLILSSISLSRFRREMKK